MLDGDETETEADNLHDGERRRCNVDYGSSEASEYHENFLLEDETE